MNVFYFISGCLAILLGVVHSVLGEVLLFRKLRESDLFSGDDESKLKKRHYNTIWSTWHLVTLFGWGFGAIFIVLSGSGSNEIMLKNVSLAISILFLVGAIFWLMGTKGKHPAWVVLGMISLLVWLAENA